MHLTKQILWSKNNPLAIYRAGKSQHVLQKRNGIFTSRKDVIYISRLYNTKTILEARKCHCYQYLNYLNLPKTDNSLLNKEEEAWVIWGVKSDSFFDNMKNWRISLDIAEKGNSLQANHVEKSNHKVFRSLGWGRKGDGPVLRTFSFHNWITEV